MIFVCCLILFPFHTPKQQPYLAVITNDITARCRHQWHLPQLAVPISKMFCFNSFDNKQLQTGLIHQTREMTMKK